MDLLSFSYSLQLAILCITLLLIFRIYRHKSTSDHPKLPPGTRGWPIIGEALEFDRALKSGAPEKFTIARMRKYSPQVFQTSLFRQNVAVFCGASGNKKLFSSAEKYVGPWWPPSMAEALNVVTHDIELATGQIPKLRSIILEVLKPEALRRYIPIMDSMAKEHLEIGWSPNYKEVKVHPMAEDYTFALACRLFINIKDPQHLTRLVNPFRLLSKGFLSAPIKLPGTAFSLAIKGGKLLHEQLLGIVRERKMELSERKGPAKEDLLTRLLLYADENGIRTDENNIASQIIGYFLGAHDTTSSTITSVLSYLADAPHVHSQVLKEQMEIANAKGAGELLNWDDIQKMKCSWNVVLEVLRLRPPSQGAFRVVKTEFTHAGYTIPKGWKTFWTVASTNKNPEYFPDPEKFDPSRFEGSGPAPYAFVPFGGGSHMCPGKEFARLTILTFIHNVVIKYKWEKVIANEKVIYNPTPFPVNGFPVRLQPLLKN